MKHYRTALPPLDYLLFFEAAARHGNFTKAATELNVSQAAVSKRVKYLEEWLGMELISRNGRTIDTSFKGAKLATHISEALDYLSMSIAQVSHINQEKLSLAANVTVSQYWLTPRINEYLLERDAVPVTLTSSDRDVDLFNMGSNAIIFYGTDIPAGWDGVVLFEEIWQPLAAPDFDVSNVDFNNITLLDFEKVTPKWVNWPDFLSSTEFTQFENSTLVNLGAYGSTIDAAIRGKGIALGCPDVLSFEIEAGRLCPLPGFAHHTNRTYFVIWKPGTMSQRTRDLLQAVGIRC